MSRQGDCAADSYYAMQPLLCLHGFNEAGYQRKAGTGESQSLRRSTLMYVESHVADGIGSMIDSVVMHSA